MANVYTRAGAAFQAGAPLGASIDVAKNTSLNSQAQAAGAAFGVKPASPFVGTATGSDEGWQGAASNWLQKNVGDNVNRGIGALGVPVQKVGDYYEAGPRTITRLQNKVKGSGDVGGNLHAWASAFYAIPGLGFVDPEFRKSWAETQTAQSSPGQTLWLTAANAGDTYEDTYALLDAPVYNQRPAATQDDPYPETAREEYFGSGWAKWTTGTFDAAFSVFADPLVIGGVAASAGHAAINTIKATDVAAASRGATNLTLGGRRVQSTVDRVIDASERVRSSKTAGGYGDLADTAFFKQSADAGAIPLLFKQLDNIVDDAARTTAKRDAVYAGMGDREALGRLEKTNSDLALQLEAVNGPNRAGAIAGLLQRKEFSHLENLKAVDEDAFLDKVVASHSDWIKATQQGLVRTHDIGAPTGLTGDALKATTGVGELDRVTLVADKLDLMKVGKTIQRGPGLPRVHYVTGRHIPGTFQLSAPDAFQSFRASTREAQGMFRKDSVAANRFNELEDEFATAYGATDPAASRAARRATVDKFHRSMENVLVRRHGGGDVKREQQVRAAIQEVRSNRTDEMLHLRERAYRVNKDDGIGYTQDDAGVLVFDTQEMKKTLGTPIDATQFEDLVVLPSYKQIDHMLTTKFKDGLDGYVRQNADGAWKFTENGLTAFNDLWKFGALFRAGYVVRNLVDSQLRNLAMIQSLRFFSNMVEGSKNLVYNNGKATVSEIETASRHAAAKTRLEQVNERLAGNIDDETRLTLETERDQLQRDLSNKVTVHKDDGSIDPTKVRRRNTELARYLGKGEGRTATYRSTAEFDRTRSQISASDSVLNLMTDQNRRALTELRSSGQVQVVAGSHPLWTKSYLEMANKHVRNSHALMRILAGDDADAIAHWYKTDSVGRAQYAGFNGRYGSEYDLAQNQVEQMDTLMPPGSRLRAQLMGGPLTKTSVDDWFTGVTKPAVPAEMLEGAQRDRGLKAVVSGYDNLRSWYFKHFGEMPETMVARHPFYHDRFQMHLERTLASTGSDAEKLSLAQVNKARTRANVLARQDVAKYAFDTSQRSNLNYHLRFLMPFYGAWSDTMRKWGRIAGENLEVLPMIPKIAMAPNAATLVIDDDGNRILRNGDVVGPDGEVIRKSADFTEGYIVLGVPEWMTGLAGGSDQIKVSKGSLNVTFQGSPWWLPGPGPLMSIPANEIALKAFPEAWDDKSATGATLRYLLPFGLEDGSGLVGNDQLDRATTLSLPMWARNLATATTQSFDDDRFAQTYAMLYADEINRQRTGESDQKSATETQKLVANRARNWFILRFMGSEAPFSTQPTGRLDFYRQEWQRYQKSFGSDARQKFFEDYPDYFEATISLSANDSGISATDESWNEAKKYQAQIKSDPKFGWMYVGAANMAPGFDSGVYTAQKATGLRSTKDPVQAFTDLQTNKGWYDFSKVSGAIDLKLSERKASGGSASLTADSNRDLKALKDEFVATMKSDNPQWATAYEQGGNGRGALEFLRSAAQAVEQKPELNNRSDFAALNDYLRMRDSVQSKLEERYNNGGSRSLTAASNADLSELWGEFTSELRDSDLGFQQMWTRGGLERDDLTGG